jgi:hypothetical protein
MRTNTLAVADHPDVCSPQVNSGSSCGFLPLLSSSELRAKGGSEVGAALGASLAEQYAANLSVLHVIPNAMKGAARGLCVEGRRRGSHSSYHLPGV